MCILHTKVVFYDQKHLADFRLLRLITAIRLHTESEREYRLALTFHLVDYLVNVSFNKMGLSRCCQVKVAAPDFISAFAE